MRRRITARSNGKRHRTPRKRHGKHHSTKLLLHINSIFEEFRKYVGHHPNTLQFFHYGIIVFLNKSFLMIYYPTPTIIVRFVD